MRIFKPAAAAPTFDCCFGAVPCEPYSVSCHAPRSIGGNDVTAGVFDGAGPEALAGLRTLSLGRSCFSETSALPMSLAGLLSVAQLPEVEQQVRSYSAAAAALSLP